MKTKLMMIAAVLAVSSMPVMADLNSQITNINNNINSIRRHADEQELVADYTKGVYADINANRMRVVCKDKGKYEIVKMGVADNEHPDAQYNVKDISCWED